MQFNSIWPIHRTLLGATTLGWSGSGSNGNEGMLHIPQSSTITGTLPSDCFVLYPGYSLRGLSPLTGQRNYFPSRGNNNKSSSFQDFLFIWIAWTVDACTIYFIPHNWNNYVQFYAYCNSHTSFLCISDTPGHTSNKWMHKINGEKAQLLTANWCWKTLYSSWGRNLTVLI